MKRSLAALIAVVVLTVAVASSRQDAPPGLRLDPENRNPWTNSKLNNGPESFQFAIVSDRTGGHRDKVFSRAVDRLNLLQPEFVVSVGDLIEGGKKKSDQIEAEWKEFDGYVKKLTMPFFYVPGNHDTGFIDNDKIWEQRLGRRFYHFVYRDVMFLCLNTDDHTGSGAPSLGVEQVAYAKKALSANPKVRWTLVFLHKPIWTATDLKKRGWADVEAALAGRKYTVFCGHVHKYRKFVRQGRDYYQLATTGGGSKMRGIGYGEFDQIVWVTMTKDGPILANVVLDSVLTDELTVPESSEVGVKVARAKTYPARGFVYLDGVPVPGAQVTFTAPEKETKRKQQRADAMTEGDGSFVLSAYTANDGAPAGRFIVTVTLRRPAVTPDGKAGPNLLPAKYAAVTTSGLEVEVTEGENEFRIDLKR